VKKGWWPGPRWVFAGGEKRGNAGSWFPWAERAFKVEVLKGLALFSPKTGGRILRKEKLLRRVKLGKKTAKRTFLDTGTRGGRSRKKLPIKKSGDFQTTKNCRY